MKSSRSPAPQAHSRLAWGSLSLIGSLLFASSTVRTTPIAQKLAETTSHQVPYPAVAMDAPEVDAGNPVGATVGAAHEAGNQDALEGNDCGCAEACYSLPSAPSRRGMPAVTASRATRTRP